MSPNQPLSPLSKNLRKWRLRRGLTASGLARAANISKSTVSELERGNGNPSLDTLWALAQTLNVSLGTLFSGAPSRVDAGVLRLGDASVMASDGEAFVARLLASWPSRGEVELAIVDLAAGARRDSHGNAPGVLERAVCVEGIVEVGTAGQSSVLNPGDMMTFAADQPHFYQPVGGPGRLAVVQQYPEYS
jgi:transcriptional regulator with XRE-family HTH domain